MFRQHPEGGLAGDFEAARDAAGIRAQALRSRTVKQQDGRNTARLQAAAAPFHEQHALRVAGPGVAEWSDQLLLGTDPSTRPAQHPDAALQLAHAHTEVWPLVALMLRVWLTQSLTHAPELQDCARHGLH